ncbi:MAG: hypothetical protein R3C11_06460 [Planctomycetaceae bacterium]
MKAGKEYEQIAQNDFEETLTASLRHFEWNDLLSNLRDALWAIRK